MGLGLAGVSYHAVSLIGVAVSSAKTVEELHAVWHFLGLLVALRIAPVGGGWVCNQLLGKQINTD